MAGSLSLIAVDLSPLRETPAFRWLWFGDVFSTLGRQFATVTIPFQVYELTHSSLMVGLISLTSVVPLVAGALTAGVVADAVDRRKMILVTQSCVCVLAVLFAINASLPHPQMWAIFVLGVLQASFGSFDSSARRAGLANIVGVNSMASALALQQLLNSVGKLGIPALAGVIIAATGVRFTYWLWAAFVLLGLLMVSGLPALRPVGGGRRIGFSSLREGLAYVRHAPLIRSLFYIDLAAMVFGLPRALFPAIGTTVLGGTAVTVGLLYAAPGAGTFIGALGSGWLGRVRHQGRVIVFAVSIYGAAMAAFALSPWIGLTLFFLAAAGASDMFSSVLRTTLTQLSAPDNLRGRVASVNKAVVSGGPLLGDVRASVLASLTSPVVSVVAGGLAVVALSAGLAWRYPVLRNVSVVGGELIRDEPPPAVATGGAAPLAAEDT